MHKAKRDYVVFERAKDAGEFFVKFPRHRVLNGINRIHTGPPTPHHRPARPHCSPPPAGPSVCQFRRPGSADREFNLLHDWYSLLLEDEDLVFSKCALVLRLVPTPSGCADETGTHRYSTEFYPKADDYVRYLRDVVKKLRLTVCLHCAPCPAMGIDECVFGVLRPCVRCGLRRMSST